MTEENILFMVKEEIKIEIKQQKIDDLVKDIRESFKVVFLE